MNKHLKRALMTGASLLLLASFGVMSKTTTHSVHASMPWPENYRSTSRRNNVYYGISNHSYNEGVNYYLYGKMPKPMLKRGHVFGLYYGKKYNKEIGYQHTSLDKIIHRHGQTYYPDYVGYLTPHNKVTYHGRKGFIEDIYINQKDINLRHPLRNSFKHLYQIHSIKYQPVTHTYRKVRTHRARINYRKYHTTKKSKRANRIKVQLKNKYGYYKHGIYHRYKTGYYRHGHWIKYNKAKKSIRKAHKNTKKAIPAYETAIPLYVKYIKALRYAPRYIKNLFISNKELQEMKDTHNKQYFSIPNEKGEVYEELLNGVKPRYAVKKAEKIWKYMNAKPTDYENFFNIHSSTDPKTHTPQQVKQNMENEIRTQTMSDLNQDRASIGEGPLQECYDLDDTAKQRSRELVNNFSHENDNGQYASDEDGNIDAENIACETEPTGNNNDDIAKGAANDLNNMLFYNEEPNDGIHYEDIKDHAQVGVGATIANGSVYLAEDFAE